MLLTLVIASLLLTGCYFWKSLGHKTYQIEASGVSFQEYPSSQKILIKGADVKSFEALCNTFTSCQYARDKDFVYYRQFKLTEADPKSFQLIPKSIYAKDEKNVWSYGRKVKDADVASFEVVTYYRFGKDNRHLYDADKTIEGVDGSSFEVLKTQEGEYSNYTKDKNHIYYFSTGKLTKVKGAENSSFQVLISKKMSTKWGTHLYKLDYAMDSENIFRHGSILEKADRGTFRLLKTSDEKYSGFAKDSKNIFDLILGRPLKEVNRDSFTVTSEKMASDGTRNFEIGSDKN